MHLNLETFYHKDLSRRQLLKYGIGGVLAAGSFPGLFSWGCANKQSDKMPNVVLILIDTLRPDYLGFYGYRKETARFLSILANKSHCI